MILKHESQRCIQNTVEHLRWSYLRKIVDSFLRLSIFAESSILAVRLGSEYASKLQRIACNRTRTPPHMPKTLLTLIVHYINIFYRTSRFKKCSNLDITKKKKTFFNFLVYFIQLKTPRFFSETHKNKRKANGWKFNYNSILELFLRHNF